MKESRRQVMSCKSNRNYISTIYKLCIVVMFLIQSSLHRTRQVDLCKSLRGSILSSVPGKSCTARESHHVHPLLIGKSLEQKWFPTVVHGNGTFSK